LVSRPSRFSRHGLAGDGQDVAVQAALLQQLPQHGGRAAGPVEALAQILAGRLHVDDQRDVVGRAPVVGGDLQAGVTGHGRDVRLGVGRAAGRRHQGDGVLEGLLGQDVEGLTSS
jgi:hypothetical protein